MVHRFAEYDVAVGVEASSEFFAVIGEVRLDGVEVAAKRVALVLAGSSESSGELVRRSIRDLSEATGNRETLTGRGTALVVVALQEVWIGLNGSKLKRTLRDPIGRRRGRDRQNDGA